MATRPKICFGVLISVLWTINYCSSAALYQKDVPHNGTDWSQGDGTTKDKSTCKMKEFNMKIEDEHCTTRFIKNKFCYGYCNSLFIPQYAQQSIKLCKACLPGKNFVRTLILNCMRDGKQFVRDRKVRVIKSCKCKNVAC